MQAVRLEDPNTNEHHRQHSTQQCIDDKRR